MHGGVVGCDITSVCGNVTVAWCFVVWQYYNEMNGVMVCYILACSPAWSALGQLIDHTPLFLE